MSVQKRPWCVHHEAERRLNPRSRLLGGDGGGDATSAVRFGDGKRSLTLRAPLESLLMLESEDVRPRSAALLLFDCGVCWVWVGVYWVGPSKTSTNLDEVILFGGEFLDVGVGVGVGRGVVMWCF